jgi:hypothetical protein
MGNDEKILTHLDCFGTGLLDSGRPQRPETCDTCADVRPCLIRQCLAAAGRSMSPPDAIDRFVPDAVRVRIFPRSRRG